MVVYALLIINKAGGLIYNRTFHSGLNVLSNNDLLVLAGTFHGIHAISKTLSPSLQHSQRASTTEPHEPSSFKRPFVSGIETLQSSRFLLTCLQTPTGTKFLLFSEPAQDARQCEGLLRKTYELYADFVGKNPFWSLEMPIRCEKFDRAVGGWIGVR
ncbi:MAG: hypothetical protein M1828_005599 [Chrysothrix sp. TS-e1954]|nr:MAG: hypothetical protein M1828_005599 [Chrysothrix sp. TS-e1954]